MELEHIIYWFLLSFALGPVAGRFIAVQDQEPEQQVSERSSMLLGAMD